MMPDLISILERQEIQDGQGGLTEEWNESYQMVPARLSDIRGSESILAGREHLRAEYMLTVPHSQRIDEGMRVRFGSRMFEVVFVNNDRSLRTATRCLVRLA